MSAPAGNTYHLLRERSGRNRKFEKPEDFWNECVAYFEWCDANPWMKAEQLKKPYKSKDADGKETWHTVAYIPTARPYTKEGLCLFIGIDTKTFDNYSNENKERAESYKDFFPIASRVKAIIYNQKFEGAAVGAFNASIIARDLGLADKHEVDTPPDSQAGPFKVQIVPPDAAE